MTMPPIRQEFLGGRLVKITDVVNVSENLYDKWVPGRWMWQLDGREITEAEALRLLDEGREVVGYLVDGKVWHPSDVTIIRRDP